MYVVANFGAEFYRHKYYENLSTKNPKTLIQDCTKM